MSPDTGSGERRWYNWLCFWRPTAVKERVYRGNFTSVNGYGNYSESRGLSFLSFAWIGRWIGAVAYGGAGNDKYPPLPCSDFDTFASTELSLYLMQIREVKRGPFFNTVLGNLRLSLMRVYRYAFAYLMVLTVLKDAMELFVICLLKAVVAKSSLHTKSAIASYLISICIVAAVVTTDAFVEAYHHFYYRRLSLRMEITLHTLLFGKILARERNIVLNNAPPLTKKQETRSFGGCFSPRPTAPKPELEQSDEVSILNLALFDVFEVSNGVVRAVDLLNVPIKLLMLSMWLYGEMGWLSAKSLFLLVLSSAIMLLCECQCASLLKEYVRRVDLRMFKTQVVLEDLRNLRLLKWAGYAMASVMGSRVHELQICLKRAYLGAISGWMGMVSPFTMGLFIFVVSARSNSPMLKGMNLDKSLALPLLHALGYFIRPLKRLPADINDHLETTLSCRRLEDYVCRKVLDTHIPTAYDRFSERVPSSNYECRYPYKIELSTLRDGKTQGVFRILGRKILNHIPLWMLPRKSLPTPMDSPRSLAGCDIDKENQTMSLIRSRDSIKPSTELLSDSYMGVTYPHVAQLSQASFSWNRRPVLSNINLTLGFNQVTLVMGPPGSGKTSLLNAIMGELQLLSGSVCVVPREVNLPIGYVSQEPWIPVGTVRDCILFGHVMDESAYNLVVSAAGLDVDFNSWEHGDMRVVDEGGQNLSTGQRMRISLARCVYNQMMHSTNAHSAKYTLYCLDDLFTVLDPALSVKVFKSLFGAGGLMVNSSVIMVVQSGFIDMIHAGGVNLGAMNFYVFHIDGLLSSSCCQETLDKFMGHLDLSHNVENTVIEEIIDDPVSSVFTERVSRRSTQLGDTDQMQGSLSVKNFMWLFNHIGMRTVLLTLMLSFVSVSLNIFSDQVIRSWGNVVDTNRCSFSPCDDISSKDHEDLLSENYDSFMQSKLNHYYTFTFVNALKIVFCLCICFIEPLGTFQAARTIYRSALSGVLHSPLSAFSSMRIGTINNRLSTDQTYVDYNIFSRFSHTTSSVIYTTMSVITVCVLNWWSGVTLPFVLFLTFVIVLRDYLPMCRENMRDVLGSRGVLCTMISQTMTGASVIRSGRREGAAMSQFLRYLDIHERAKFYQISAVAWSNVRIRLLSFPLIFVNLLSPLISLLIDTPASCGTALDAHVSTALMYSLKFSKSLKGLISMMVDVSNAMCACQRLQELSRLGPHYDPRFETLRLSSPYCLNCGRKRACDITSYRRSDLAVTFSAVRTGVEIRDMIVDYSFRPDVTIGRDVVAKYTSDAQLPFVRQASVRCDHLFFPPGEHVGVVGRTGSGKSSLLAALAGAVELVSGTITLDGVDISVLSTDDSCEAIGNIPHNPPLLVHWTVRDYVDPRHEWDDLAIWDALYACSIGAFVRSLPGVNPLDVMLKKSWQNKCQDVATTSETSENYLSLARLLLYRRDLRLLLIDESSLVGGSDEHDLTPIPELLHRLFRDCNVFIVAHHAESLKLCDRILVLDGGRVVGECLPSEVGNQQELASRCHELASAGRPTNPNYSSL